MFIITGLEASVRKQSPLLENAQFLGVEKGPGTITQRER